MVSTSATNDAVTDEVVLSPADTANGESYTSVSDDGEIEIQISNLNVDATTTIPDVFVIKNNRDTAINASVADDGTGSVTFYDSATGDSIEGSENKVEISSGDSVSVGVKIESGTSSINISNVTVTAEIPEDDSSGSSGNSGSSGSSGNSGSSGSSGNSGDDDTDTITTEPADDNNNTDDSTSDTTDSSSSVEVSVAGASEGVSVTVTESQPTDTSQSSTQNIDVNGIQEGDSVTLSFNREETEDSQDSTGETDDSQDSTGETDDSQDSTGESDNNEPDGPNDSDDSGSEGNSETAPSAQLTRMEIEHRTEGDASYSVTENPEPTKDTPDGTVGSNSYTIESTGSAEPSEATLEFSVDRSTVDANGLDPSDATALRAPTPDSEWENLETEVTDTTEEEYVYEATTPGFSEFTLAFPAADIGTDYLNVPQSIRQNQSVTIDAAVSNTGRIAGETRLQVLQNGTTVYSQITTAEANQTATIREEVMFIEPGTYTVKLGNQTTTVEVTNSTAADQTATPQETSTEVSTVGLAERSFGPEALVAALTAVGVLSVLLALLRRRQRIGR